MKADLVAVPRALLEQLHDHYDGPERTDPVADPLWTELGAYLDGRAELPDRYTKLAHAMDCTEAEVPHRIQEHAPWNGRPHCEDAERERKAAANLFRVFGMSLVAVAVERGDHIPLLSRIPRPTQADRSDRE